MLLRIRDGCACSDEGWVAAMKLTQSLESTQYITQMGAEYAFIGM